MATTFPILVVAPAAAGRFSMEVRVEGRIAAAPQRITLAATEMVRTPLAWSDGRPVIDLGRITRSDLPFVCVIPLPRGDHPFAWDQLELEATVVDASLISVSSEGAQWSLRVAIPADSDCGVLTLPVAIGFRAGAQTMPYVDRRMLRLQVGGPLSAHPPLLVVPAPAPSRNQRPTTNRSPRWLPNMGLS